MKNRVVLRMIGFGQLSAILAISFCSTHVSVDGAPQLKQPGRFPSLADEPASRWQTYMTSSGRRLVARAKSAADCLALADKQLARGYWRLSLLRSGAVKYLRPPVEENWATALAAFSRGDKLVANAKTKPLSAVRAALISHRAIFLVHISGQDTRGVLLQAIRAIQKAKSLDPNSSEILSELGGLYGQLTSVPGIRKQEALAYERKELRYSSEAITLNPRCTVALWNLAAVQLEHGDINAAVTTRVQALRFSRFTSPVYVAYDYHSLNFWTHAMAKYIKEVQPNTYKTIRGSIAYFSPSGIAYSAGGEVLQTNAAERKP